MKKKKSHAQKVAAAATRKALRARILRVLERERYSTDPNHVPVLDGSTNRRVAALLRELLDT